jgi:hypothetical protein
MRSPRTHQRGAVVLAQPTTWNRFLSSVLTDVRGSKRMGSQEGIDCYAEDARRCSSRPVAAASSRIK